MGRKRKQINLPPPPAEDIAELVATRRGLSTDPRNTRRRASYARRDRWCPDCGTRLQRHTRLCSDCAAKHAGRYRVCLGAYGRPCPDSERVWDRMQRCVLCRQLREMELNEQRNERRRVGVPMTEAEINARV
jgi:hypothetical protein